MIFFEHRQILYHRIHPRYIAFPKVLLDNVSIDRKAYALSLEMLVKISGLKVIEIPYTFMENDKTKSKLIPSIIDYTRSVLRLYKQGPKSIDEPGNADYKKSVMFLSQAGRYYTVGAIGLLLNYVVSILFTNSFNDRFVYLDGTVVGIIFSIHSNFIMNKVWTFMDRNFTLKHLL